MTARIVIQKITSCHMFNGSAPKVAYFATRHTKHQKMSLHPFSLQWNSHLSHGRQDQKTSSQRSLRYTKNCSEWYGSIPKCEDPAANTYLQEAHSEHAQGFWQEFFLLKPDFASLRRILDALSPDSLLLHQVRLPIIPSEFSASHTTH